MLAGLISAGQLSAFVFYAVVVASGAGTVSEVWGEIQRAAGATERLMELLDTRPALAAAAPVRRMPVQATGAIRFDYGYVIGDPSATHQPPGPDRAPFAVARSFEVTQAPPEAVTHRDAGSRYAIDIGMPVGSAVHAGREGLVINVAHRFFRGGTRQEVRDEANFVQVLHDDGTTAVYGHLQMSTVRVRPGQRVQRGEYIANAGNTGFSSGTHLHFVVLRNAGLLSESVPVAFAGPGGTTVVPRTGQALTAY